MGCCFSKQDENEDDIITPQNNPNDSVSDYGTFVPIDYKKEQEFWKTVLERTTHNLIDISSFHGEPLQSRDAAERAAKYREALVQLNKERWEEPESPLQTSGPPLDICKAARPFGGMNQAKRDALHANMVKLQEALNQIQVQPRGDMVVHLTMALAES